MFSYTWLFNPLRFKLSRKSVYNYLYFERGIQSGLSLYTDYRWIPDLTIPMAMAIIDYLGIKRGQKVLDYGCAKGFMVKALRWLGREAYGCDTSQYVLDTADPEISSYLSKDLPKIQFHYTICKDTFEHMQVKDIRRLLTNLNSKVLFVIVPLGDGKKYFIPAYELDKTHIHKQSLYWWTDLIKNNGWKIKSAVPLVPGIKDNWNYQREGNAFIVAERQ